MSVLGWAGGNSSSDPCCPSAWNGVTCEDNGSGVQRVVRVSAQTAIGGEAPAQFGQLTSLRGLELRDTQFTGGVPVAWADAPLEELVLDAAGFDGAQFPAYVLDGLPSISVLRVEDMSLYGALNGGALSALVSRTPAPIVVSLRDLRLCGDLPLLTGSNSTNSTGLQFDVSGNCLAGDTGQALCGMGACTPSPACGVSLPCRSGDGVLDSTCGCSLCPQACASGQSRVPGSCACSCFAVPCAGTLNAATCSCSCADVPCVNGGSQDSACRCQCPQACAAGQQQNPDCSCTRVASEVVTPDGTVTIGYGGADGETPVTFTGADFRVDLTPFPVFTESARPWIGAPVLRRATATPASFSLRTFQATPDVTGQVFYRVYIDNATNFQADEELYVAPVPWLADEAGRSVIVEAGQIYVALKLRNWPFSAPGSSLTVSYDGGMSVVQETGVVDGAVDFVASYDLTDASADLGLFRTALLDEGHGALVTSPASLASGRISGSVPYFSEKAIAAFSLAVGPLAPVANTTTGTTDNSSSEDDDETDLLPVVAGLAAILGVGGLLLVCLLLAVPALILVILLFTCIMMLCACAIVVFVIVVALFIALVVSIGLVGMKGVNRIRHGKRSKKEHAQPWWARPEQSDDVDEYEGISSSGGVRQSHAEIPHDDVDYDDDDESVSDLDSSEYEDVSDESEDLSDETESDETMSDESDSSIVDDEVSDDSDDNASDDYELLSDEDDSEEELLEMSDEEEEEDLLDEEEEDLLEDEEDLLEDNDEVVDEVVDDDEDDIDEEDISWGSVDELSE